ncbi:hypothetical protein [Caballeronia mineralivorans]|uniref:hypothetical protein n=1 Tax=Caballeronia mineralivorans TaxID=2010198 RepID=UPI0038992686
MPAVKRVEAGESPEDVIRTLAFSRPHIYEWFAAYRGGGIQALRVKAIPGRPAKLSSDAMRFDNAMGVSTPDQQADCTSNAILTIIWILERHTK